MIELIPNWHPVWVHFAIALLMTGAACHVVALIQGPKAESPPASLIVARWTSWLGVLAAGVALLTGFWAAGSVAHDDLAHANMMVHRNWAVASLVLFVLASAFEWLRRSRAHASGLTAALSLAGAVAIGVTGFEGGQNVFEHGLGVQRLPDVGGHDHQAHGHGGDDAEAGEPHDDGHDHGPAMDEHGDSQAHAATDSADEAGGHDHAPEDHDEGSATEDGVTGGHDHGGHDHGPTSQAGSETVDTSEPAMISARLADALAAGDSAAVAELVDDGVLIFESGNAETSRSEYEGHHMPADMAFLAAMERELISRRVIVQDDDGAVVTSRSRLFGRYKEQEVDVTSTETLVLRKSEGTWRIVHIHWSSS